MKDKLRKAIIEMLFEVEFKPLLEMNDEIADLYDSGKITRNDFYEILEELKSKLEK